MRRMMFCVGLGVFWSLAVPVSAQPLADRLPASTMVYVGWSPNASLQTTATAKMLADERFMVPWRRVFQEMMLDLPDVAEGGVRLSAQLPQLLLDAAQCEGCFALLDLKQGKRRLDPQSVLMIDLGAKRKSFEEHFAPIQQRIKARLGDRLKSVKLQDSSLYVKSDGEGKSRITWGFVGDTFIAFMGDGAEEFIPKLLAGKIEASLKNAPAFADCLNKIPGESVFTAYLDTQASLAMVRRLVEREGNSDLMFIGKNWDNVLAEFGLNNVRGIGEKTVIEDKQFVTRTLLRTQGAPSGMLGLLVQPAVDEAMMKVIPRDAMAAAAIRLDPAKAYEQLKTSAINIGGNDAKESFGQLEQGAEGIGLPIKVVLEAMGDQWVVYNATSSGGFALTGWTLVGNIRNPEQFNKSLNVVRGIITKGLSGEGEQSRIHVLDADATKIEYLELGRSGVPVSPAWTVVGDKFVFALYPQLVEDAAKQIKEGGKSLLDNADFSAARRRTGNDGPMVFVSGPEVTRNLYPVGLVFVSALNSFAGGFHDVEDGSHVAAADLLPSMQRLMQYVGHDTLAVKVTPDGILKTRSVTNPLLSPLAWLDSPILWMAIGIPSAGAGEQTADRVQSAANLRQIGQAVLLYSNEKRGKFPPDLASLIKTQGLPVEATKSPFGPAKGGTDIILVSYGAINPAAAPIGGGEIIIAYDQAALEQGEGTNALFADGHVDWLAAQAFKMSLEESRKKAILQNAQP
jgi:prepilin-type processing-associated H-X9-DG protein